MMYPKREIKLLRDTDEGTVVLELNTEGQLISWICIN